MIWLYTPAEVADFDDVSFFDKNVFWFDVPMNQALLVHKVNAWADLDEEVECSVFAQELFLSNEVEQVAFARVLESKHDCVTVFEWGVETTDVLMVHLFLNSYLTNKCFFYLVVSQTFLLYFFNSYFEATCSMLCKLYLTVRTFTKIGFFALHKI